MFPFFFFFLVRNSGEAAEDRDRLTTFVAWERVFGRIAVSWDELAERGLSLNREEAKRYVEEGGEMLSTERGALYEVLFDQHPELKLSLFSSDELLESIKDDGEPSRDTDRRTGQVRTERTVPTTDERDIGHGNCPQD